MSTIIHALHSVIFLSLHVSVELTLTLKFLAGISLARIFVKSHEVGLDINCLLRRQLNITTLRSKSISDLAI